MNLSKSVGERIRELRQLNGFTQEELAQKTGYTSRSSINKIEKGLVDLSRSKIIEIATALGTTPAYLMGWEEDSPAELPSVLRPVSTKKLPLLGNVACGEPIFADETRDAYIAVGNSLDADFCLTARGDSMINARIFDGDILFVKKQEIVNDGEIAVVLVEDEATVKRVYYDKENNIITLLPENPMYKPMRYSGSDLERIRILGKVVLGQYVI